MTRSNTPSLLTIVGIVLGWAWSRGRRNFQAIAGLQASSRVAYTVSMFLPIKILILVTASNGRPPAYFSKLAPFMSYPTFIWLLVLAVLLTYVYSTASKLLARKLMVTRKCQVRVADSAPQRLPLPQSKLSNLYERALRIGGDTAVVGLCLLGIGICDWRLGAACLLLTAFHLAVAEVLAPSRTAIPDALVTGAHVIEYAGAAVFLMSFAAAVGLNMWLGSNLYFSILATLLARQLFQASERILVELDRMRREFGVKILAAQTGAARGALPG